MTTASLSFLEKIIHVSAALERAGIPFAFGGAIARNYYTEPRLTRDMDLGVFLPPRDHARVLATLATLFPIPDADQVERDVLRDQQVRLVWGENPVDLFFSFDPFHEASRARVRRVPVVDDIEIPILAAEDVILHKLLFNRPKDWADIADLLYSQRDTLDLSYIDRWLTSFFPPDETRPEDDPLRYDTRRTRFAELVAAVERQGGGKDSE
jgi:hypothetical protein